MGMDNSDFLQIGRAFTLYNAGYGFVSTLNTLLEKRPCDIASASAFLSVSETKHLFSCSCSTGARLQDEATCRFEAV